MQICHHCDQMIENLSPKKLILADFVLFFLFLQLARFPMEAWKA